MYIVHNIPEEDLVDIVDEVFNVNFEAIMDNDKDASALSEDSDYNSDQSKDTKSKVVYPLKVIALNVLMKQCVIYFYYTTDSSLILHTCMTRLANIEHMYTIKYVIKSHAVKDSKYCSE